MKRALAAVHEGRLYDLGRELHEDIPVFPGRHFKQTLVPNPGAPLGANEVDWTTEIVSSPLLASPATWKPTPTSTP